MGISDADTTKNPSYFRFVCEKTAPFANDSSVNTLICVPG